MWKFCATLSPYLCLSFAWQQERERDREKRESAEGRKSQYRTEIYTSNRLYKRRNARMLRIDSAFLHAILESR